MNNINEQVDGLNGITNDSWNPTIEKPKTQYVFSVFPSRSTHRCQVIDRPGVWLEIVAWLLRLDPETGHTSVFPITQFGNYWWKNVTAYQSPNMRQSQRHW